LLVVNQETGRVFGDQQLPKICRRVALVGGVVERQVAIVGVVDSTDAPWLGIKLG